LTGAPPALPRTPRNGRRADRRHLHTDAAVSRVRCRPWRWWRRERRSGGGGNRCHPEDPQCLPPLARLARPDPAGDRLWIVIDGRCGDVYGLQSNASGDGMTKDEIGLQLWVRGFVGLRVAGSRCTEVDRNERNACIHSSTASGVGTWRRVYRSTWYAAPRFSSSSALIAWTSARGSHFQSSRYLLPSCRLALLFSSPTWCRTAGRNRCQPRGHPANHNHRCDAGLSLLSP
jgi:hypothetical protein